MVTPAYEPGWEHVKKGSEKLAEQAVAENRKKVIERMTGFSTLLQDVGYSSAIRVVQDYNLKMNSDTNRPSVKAYDAAIQTMERIEKEKGIDAVSSVMKK